MLHFMPGLIKRTVFNVSVLTAMLSCTPTFAVQVVDKSQPWYEQSYNDHAQDEHDRFAYVEGEENSSLAKRVERLENKLNTSGLLNLQESLQKLELSIQKLQGKIEENEYQLTKLKTEQLALYKDLESRLSTASLEPKSSGKKVGAEQGNTMQAASNTTYPATETELYAKAYQLIQSQSYPAAIEQLTKYLQAYPNGKYAPGSYYWLGELYLAQSKYDLALEAFRKVETNWPDNVKAKDALLKIGLTALAGQNIAEAKQAFNKVLQKYPNTSAAKIASARLKEIK